eukprot:m.602703 g.602703  ORF g.602703 m.602703 type:complete len:61 (-) comp22450_c0_seq4:1903-2085(-)
MKVVSHCSRTRILRHWSGTHMAVTSINITNDAATALRLWANRTVPQRGSMLASGCSWHCG